MGPGPVPSIFGVVALSLIEDVISAAHYSESFWTIMAEGLAFAASVIAVIQITEQVISACVSYYRIAKASENDVNRTIDSVSGLKSVLENLGNTIKKCSKDPADPRLKSLKALSTDLKESQGYFPTAWSGEAQVYVRQESDLAIQSS